MTAWNYYPGLSPLERMEKNDDYWEEQYNNSSNRPPVNRETKECTICGWIANTTLVLCPKDKNRLRFVHTVEAAQ